MNGSRPAAQALLACLGEESRFRLVQALIGGARCVSDLAAEVGLSQSCTTRHLQSLERRRLVTGRREGKRVLYRIRDDDPGLLPLLGWALSRPKGAAGVGAPRVSRMGKASRAGRRPGGAMLDPGDPPPAGPPGPVPRDSGGVAERPPRPKSASESSAPATELRPLVSATARPVRRAGGSDIEDYLL